MVVLDHRAGKQVRLAQYLEPITDAQHGQPAKGCRDQRGHDRCEAGDGTRSKVIAIGEATGQHHRVDAAQRVVTVPQRNGLAAGDADGAVGVVVIQ